MRHKFVPGLILAIIVSVITGVLYLPRSMAVVGHDRAEFTDNLSTLESSFNPKIIYRGHVGRQKLVALTVDDGPDPSFTPQVLNIEKRYHIKVTFFVVGESIKQHPDLLKREIAAGNEIENHTYTHPDLQVDGLLPTEEEIVRNQELIESYTNKMPQYFRPPKGLMKNETVDISEANGCRVVLWTMCVEHKACKTPQEMAARLVRAACPGMIILAHDGRLDRSRTMAALPLIIQGYQTKGYRFVTLEEMLNQEQHPGKPGVVAQGSKKIISNQSTHCTKAGYAQV